MFEVPSDRSKPAEPTSDVQSRIGSHPDPVEQVSQVPESQVAQPKIESVQDTPADDRYQEFREWCERRRTNWPDSKDFFLSDNEALLTIDIDGPYPSNPRRTKKDYAWVPNALWEIFNSDLKQSL